MYCLQSRDGRERPKHPSSDGRVHREGSGALTFNAQTSSASNTERSNGEVDGHQQHVLIHVEVRLIIPTGQSAALITYQRNDCAINVVGVCIQLRDSKCVVGAFEEQLAPVAPQ
jgi:hypothetical protein